MYLYPISAKFLWRKTLFYPKIFFWWLKTCFTWRRMLENSFCDWYTKDCQYLDTEKVFWKQESYTIGHVNLQFLLALTSFASHYHIQDALANCINNITCGPWEIAQAGSQTVTNTRNKYHYPTFWSQMELIDLEVAGFLLYELRITWQRKGKHQEHKTLIADSVHL